MITITRNYPVTHQPNTMNIPMTMGEYLRAHDAWKSGTLIQATFPMLDVGQREFIKTGITPAVWDRMFGED